MATFYFNTGVRPENVKDWKGLYGNQILRDTVLIPFECDAPENAVFMFACDHNDLPDSKAPNCIVREIKQPNKGMASKFAYFKVPKTNS